MPTTYAIPNGATQFAATLYTGNHSTNAIVNAVNSISFQPDFIWIKDRSAVTAHVLFDSVRGVGGYLSTNNTAAEDTTQNYAKLNTFNSNGFTLGASTLANDLSNYSGDSFVSWQWKASNATPVNIAIGSISSGVPSIASTVSANPTAGFSIVTYTGTGVAGTIGHGLNSTPKMIIVKWRTGGTTESWAVYHTSLGATNYLSLNTTNASAAGAALWNNTAPATNVFSVGTDTWVNASTRTYVAYCWSEIDGYSKFGSYTGNGSTNGPFVYCGFKPRFIMIKQSSGSTAYTSWFMIDTSRLPYNIGSGTEPSLWANLAVQEGLRGNGVATDTINYIDILSNGFKIRSNASDEINNNTSTYIYAAFAENPFKYANAR